MTGMGAGHDAADEFAAVVIERHLQKLRADLRGLPRRAFAAGAEQSADISKTRGPEWRPAEQPRAENAERDRHRQFTLDAGEGGHCEGHHTAADLDRAR